MELRPQTKKEKTAQMIFQILAAAVLILIALS